MFPSKRPGIDNFAVQIWWTMTKRELIIMLAYFLCNTAGFSQKIKKGDKITLDNLKTNVSYLADDKLEGRRAGSNGEKLAMSYISDLFKNIGLQPRGTNGYYQAFEINEGKQISDSSYLIINNNKLAVNKEYFPLPYSPAMSLDALPALAIQEPDMPWFIDLKETLEENKQNPHFDLNDYVRRNAEKAKKKGASAIFIYNTSSIDDKLSFDGKDKSAELSIPVIYVSKEIAKKYFKDPTETLNIKFNVRINDKRRFANNVAGYIDNGATSTVVIGAHFDHLGYGEDGNSMIRTGEKQIHNGADDNASGTAAMIELARILKGSKAKANNYLFLAFSGEELGLFGSKYFVEHPTEDLGKVNYMINLDMVGRLNDSSRSLSVGGYGTSPMWASVIKPQEKNLPFVIHLDSSGSGPSDHTSFYRKDIPVLFFFTGQHKDYHRPSDDANLINYDGEVKVINYIAGVIESLDKQKQKLAFLKTRDTQVSVSSFKVTLGIMPDYTYDGTGVRADAVSEGRPASKAGVLAGDIIVQLGDNKVTSMETYMQALGKFQKGDKTKLTFKRGKDTKEAAIEF